MEGNRDIVRHIAGDLASAFALLTRLPVPDHAARGASASWAWPVVGTTIGGLAALVSAILTWIGLPTGVTAALSLGAMAMVTGALHEDGLADTADGFFGGRTRERRLEIMKDSHIGSFGTLALVLVTLARWSALTALVAGGQAVLALILAGAMSRVPMVALMAALPNARPTGLSQSVGRPGLPQCLTAIGIALALGLALAGWSMLVIAPALLVLAAVIGMTAQRRIGGQTGDVLGASQQLSDLVVLALLAALIGT